MNEFTQTIVDTNAGVPLLFLALLLWGIPVLLPVIFSAVHGALSLPVVVGVALIASTISDVIWYLIGYAARRSRRINDYVKKHLEKASLFLKTFKRRFPAWVFLSRFLYGTKIAASLFSGRVGVPFVPYLVLNIMSMLTLLLVSIAGASLIQNVATFLNLTASMRSVFSIAVLMVLAGYLFLGYYVRRRSPYAKIFTK